MFPFAQFLSLPCLIRMSGRSDRSEANFTEIRLRFDALNDQVMRLRITAEMNSLAITTVNMISSITATSCHMNWLMEE